MHGLVNTALMFFLRDSYGRQRWTEICHRAGVDGAEFASMLHYENQVTVDLLDAATAALGIPRDTVLEDLGTYLVSHPETESLRRLLRFGGDSFVEFLHSLDELPDRARMAVDDLDLPRLELRDHAANQFSLTCHTGGTGMLGFGHVMVGVLRTLADDYGALVFLEHKGAAHGTEVVDITLVEAAFAAGRSFELGAMAG